jgi:8-oxo-dGTP diphosphatase
MSATSPKIRVVSAEIERDGRYLITQRRSEAVLGGLWEFPGGRVREGETDTQALTRALRDRLDLDVEVVAETMEIEHAYESYALTLAVYRCTIPEDAEPRRLHIGNFAWVAPEEFIAYSFPGADQATVDKLVRSLE